MNVEQKQIVVVGAGILTVPLIRRARDLGIRTIVMDGNPEAPGMALADTPVVVSTRNDQRAAALAVELARSRPIDGVVTAGADVEVTVAAIAQALSLPGPGPEAAYLCNHKAAMRAALRDAGIPGPEFAEIKSVSEAAEAARAVGFPLMVKPMDNCGSRGVVRVDDSTALEPAVAAALPLSRSGSVLLEQFVEGSTHTVEMLAWDGRLDLCSIIDTHHGYAPFAVELRHENPTRLPRPAREQMLDRAREAARAIGLVKGPAKVDFLFSADGPVVMEMTARLSGGFHCQVTTPLALGTDNLRAAIDVSLGRSPRREDIEPRFERAAICQALFPAPGRIEWVRGLEEASAIPGIEQIHALAGPGDVVPPPRSSADRRFFVIAQGEDHAACERALRAAEAAIDIRTTPV
ncbi:MAG: ATP-grasp domain-containing protein [Myxococcota bacterium]